MNATAEPVRLVPDEPLPPYSYVTGRFPHPTRDPEGHSFGRQAERPPAPDPNRWQESRTYLFGCDLFNRGYYWEAHETWEALWMACGRSGTTADFLKGLIKLAAAGVKAREGRPAGVQRHAARAAQLFRAVGERVSGARFLGLDIATLIAQAERLKSGSTFPKTSSAAVEVVFDFLVMPAAQ